MQSLCTLRNHCRQRGHATLATKRTLLLTWAGLAPAGSHQLCLAHLFDHLVGEDVELRRDHYPESVGGLTIDHQVEFGRLLDRQVAGLCTLENLVDERRGATEKIEEVLAIAHQPTSLHVIALWEHGRQTVRKRKFSNTLALPHEDCV